MSNSGRPALIEAIAEAVGEMTRTHRAGGSAPWLHLDLTLPQLKVLFLLDAVGPTGPSAIAESIGVTPTGLTGILDRLEERAFVRREPNRVDRRATVILLDEAGRALLEQINAAGREQLIALLDQMDDDDLQALHQGISALIVAQSAGPSVHDALAQPTGRGGTS